MGRGESETRTDCKFCPLHSVEGLRALAPGQLALIKSFKQGQMQVDKGGEVFAEKSTSPHLFTVLSGLLFRHKTLPDGRRQVTNFSFPGDLLGLQGVLDGELDHTVEAITPAELCLFPRDRLHEFIAAQPGLGYDITWLAASEERSLDSNLLAVGRRTARERIAYLALFLVDRARQSGMARGNCLPVRITQSIIADATGLSEVHVNRTLQGLKKSGLLQWNGGGIELVNEQGLRDLASSDAIPDRPRPFI